MELQDLKQQVLTKLATLSFENRLGEKDSIAYEIIPSNSKPNFRCCIYKEREILSQRVRVASGIPPVECQDENKNQIIQVISAACEECPISRFTITENCQKCLSKSCKSACNFNAINTEGRRAFIDQDLCRECGKCKDACPYSAIADLVRPCMKHCPVDALTMDDNKKARIDYSKCIHCGRCVIHCPFGAITDISYITYVIDLLNANQSTTAIIAPAIQGQFEAATLSQIKSALLNLGFSHVVEAAEGAEMVAFEEAENFLAFTDENGFMTTSCCPSFVQLIEKHYPKLAKNISNSLSPMLEIAKHIKDKDFNTEIVFIGPCIAKKTEIMNSKNEYLVDYVLTFEELQALFHAKNIIPAQCEEMVLNQSSFGRNFAKSGGVTSSVKHALEKKNISADVKQIICNGVDECKKTLMIASSPKGIRENFIEGMICKEGCIGGPCGIVPAIKIKNLIK